MSVYLVLVEKIIPSASSGAGKVESKITSLGGVSIGGSSFLLKSNSTAHEIFSELRPFILDTDRMYVFPISKNYFGWGSPSVWDWLQKNVP